MDIREIVPGFAVAPQLYPDEMQAVADLGYRVVVCNRPDIEVPPDLSMAAMRTAAGAAGLAFVENPVSGGGLTEDALDRQREAAAHGPVLAYCASGTRSAVLWALSEAKQRPAEDILRATAAAGYPLDGLAPEIARLAER